MKKFITMIVILSLLLSFAACQSAVVLNPGSMGNVAATEPVASDTVSAEAIESAAEPVGTTAPTEEVPTEAPTEHVPVYTGTTPDNHEHVWTKMVTKEPA